MDLVADSNRICSEYKPESVAGLSRDGIAVSNPAIQGSACPAAIRRIRPVVVYMSQNLGTPLRVKTLSTLLGLSSSHFFHLFKRATGFSPIDFFNRMRVRRALELLEDTTLRMKEVAAMLGYADQFYFSRVFKSVNGVAPSEYRVLAPEFREGVRKMAWPWSSSDMPGIESGPMLAHRRLYQNAPPARRSSLPMARGNETRNGRTLAFQEHEVVSPARDRALKP